MEVPDTLAVTLLGAMPKSQQRAHIAPKVAGIFDTPAAS